MKRFISVIAILCAAMLIFSLTGCGESKKPENTTAATEAVTQAATEAPAEETEAGDSMHDLHTVFQLFL